VDVEMEVEVEALLLLLLPLGSTITEDFNELELELCWGQPAPPTPPVAPATVFVVPSVEPKFSLAVDLLSRLLVYFLLLVGVVDRSL